MGGAERVDVRRINVGDGDVRVVLDAHASAGAHRAVVDVRGERCFNVCVSDGGRHRR